MKRPAGPARARDRWIVARRGAVGVLWKWTRWRGISLPFVKQLLGAVWLSHGSFTHEERCQVRRPEVATDPLGGASTDVKPSKLLGKLDRLNDLLCSGAWDDGALKGQRCLFVFLEGPAVRVMVKVESPCLKVSAVGRDLDDALAALDVLLGSNDVPWESDIPRGEAARRKRK